MDQQPPDDPLKDYWALIAQVLVRRLGGSVSITPSELTEERHFRLKYGLHVPNMTGGVKVDAHIYGIIRLERLVHRSQHTVPEGTEVGNNSLG